MSDNDRAERYSVIKKGLIAVCRVVVSCCVIEKRLSPVCRIVVSCCVTEERLGSAVFGLALGPRG